MQTIAPDYYKDFQCIASACRHSCCIGWEIDIDAGSMTRYEQLHTPYGEILRGRIDRSGEVPHYRLGAGERCPFLRPDGLCEMVLELGEDALCQICADHPRFRNFFAHRTEMGLGLCCEAAGALILNREASMSLVVLEDDGTEDAPDGEEETLLSFRDMLLDIARDRGCTLDERMRELLDTCAAALPEGTPGEWAQKLLELERLDEGWTAALHTLTVWDRPELYGADWERRFEQALCYFLYRHLPAALEDGDVASKTAFAVFSVTLLRALCAALPDPTGAELVEFARMYSGEIEYSEENLWAVFDWLGV